MKNRHTRVLGGIILALAAVTPLFAQTERPKVDVGADSYGNRVKITVQGQGNSPNGEFSTGNRQMGASIKPPFYAPIVTIDCTGGPFPSGFQVEMIETNKDVIDINIQFRASQNCAAPAKGGQTFTVSESPSSPGSPSLRIFSDKLPAGCNGSGTGTVTVNRNDIYGPPNITVGTQFRVGYMDMDFTMACGTLGNISGKILWSEDNIPADYQPLDPNTGQPGGGGGGTEPPPPPPPPDALTGFPQTLLEKGLEMTNDSTQVITVSTITQNSFVGDVELEVVSDSTEAEGLSTSLSTNHISSPGTGTSQLTIKVGPNTFPRDYFVTIVTSANGKQAFNTLKVTVLCDPPMILGVDQPRGASVSGGGSASLETKAVGSGPFAYQWYSGPRGSTNFPVSGGTGAKLTTSNEGLYWVRVSNACGSADSATAAVIRQ